MVPQFPKLVSVTPPAAVYDNASATCATIDTKGFAFCRIVLFLGATDIAMAALYVGESDTDGSFSNVTGLVFGTSINSVGSTSSLPTAGDDGHFMAFDVDLRGRKRYLKVVATFGDSSTAGTYAAIWAELFRGEKEPATATECGVTQLLQVPTFA